MNKKRDSHDSACDSAGDESTTTKTTTTTLNLKASDDASIYSTNSTTSSMFSTSSRMSKIPKAVKSSMKFLVRRNKNRTSEDHETFAAKLKRTTINFSLFSRNKQDVMPTSTSSSMLFAQYQKEEKGEGDGNYVTKSKRRNSVVNLAASQVLVNNNSSSIGRKKPSPSPFDGISRANSEQDVGSLLFGKQVDDLEFMVHEDSTSDSKSEKMISKAKKEEPWIRQRAKSCQESKTPMLRQLATKHSSVRIRDLPSCEHTKSSTPPAQLPLFKGLVTTTLTTLHTRLINECDRAVSMLLPASGQENGGDTNNTNDNNNNNTPNRSNIPQEQLLSVITDLRKMTEMVSWEDQQQQKTQIKETMQQLEHTVLNQELNMIIAKDIVSLLKQLMNQCICQYYRVAENAIVIPSKGYRIEGNNKYDASCTEPLGIDYSIAPIDHKDDKAHWYRSYFLNHSSDVYTFFGYYQNGDPTLISIKVEEELQGNRHYRMIHRTKKSPDQRKMIEDSFLLNAPATVPTQQAIEDTTWKTIIETTIPEISFQDLVKMNGECLTLNGIQDELLRLDENSLHTRYKFGVLLIKESQTKEEEWFANNHDSDAFDEFLNIIGRKVDLKGYTGWAAGLDTKSGDSGQYTYINAWNENILAYHVSTLIPSKPGDKQQIQRKRHIGNDIVCIVFVEGNQPFNPTAIKSQFLHVFIVVHQEVKHSQKMWKVEVVSVQDVPEFGPTLPEGAVFTDKTELEKFLIAKLVNAEYAAFKSPKFALPMNRAREGIFANLVEKGYKLASTESEDQELATRKHSKSASSSSSQSSFSSIIPSPSKSNVIREFSENIVGLGRRRSTQDLNERSRNHNSSFDGNGTPSKHSGKGARKFTEGSKRSHSEQDLLNMTLDTTVAKNSFKHRILTSIPGFGQTTKHSLENNDDTTLLSNNA